METKQKILFVGAGGHAQVVQEILRAQMPNCEVVVTFSPGEEVDLLRRDSAFTAAFVGVGENFRRKEIVNALLAECAELVFPALVHPRATVSPLAKIGAGSVVMANAVVNTGATIGEHCVVNSGAIVEHDCRIGDFASLATNAALGGGVSVGDCAWVGMGASVLHGMSIGAHSALGAGSVLLENLNPRLLAYGVPAKVARARLEEEKFL